MSNNVVHFRHNSFDGGNKNFVFVIASHFIHRIGQINRWCRQNNDFTSRNQFVDIGGDFNRFRGKTHRSKVSRVMMAKFDSSFYIFVSYAPMNRFTVFHQHFYDCCCKCSASYNSYRNFVFYGFRFRSFLFRHDCRSYLIRKYIKGLCNMHYNCEFKSFIKSLTWYYAIETEKMCFSENCFEK